MAQSSTLAAILEKVSSNDKDFRYMATSDLLHELTKDSFRAAPDVEKKVIQVVLKQLDDQSGDVSTLAVRCLPPLISGCSLPNVKSVIDGLLERLCCVDGKDAEIRAKRDAGVIGLKTVIENVTCASHQKSELTAQIVTTLVPRLLTKLTDAIASGEVEKDTGVGGDLAGDALDVLTLTAARHGAYMTGGAVSAGSEGSIKNNDATNGGTSTSTTTPSSACAIKGVSPETALALERALLEYLARSGRQGTRKRAAACLASLGASSSDGFLSRCALAARSAIDRALDGDTNLTASQRDELVGPYASLLGAVAHASGSRFGAFASKSFPRILALTERAHEEGSETLRETCLRTIERFVLSCPGSITEQLPIVVVTSLALMTHDPLYGDDGGGENSDDDGNDDNSAMDDDEEKNGSEYGSEYDASEYSDDGDDDQSWKVRRGAARVLAAVATKAPLSLEPQFVAIVKKLLKRGFQERDEQCRLEVFGALETILRASSAKRHAPAALQSLVSSVSRDIGLAAAKWSTDSVSKKDKEFGVKSSLKIRTAAFHVLTELAVGVPNALSGDNVFGTVCASLASTLIATDGNTNVGAGANTQDAAGTSEVRVAALFFARVAAETANPTETSPHLSVIASPLVHAMSDRYYKTAAEAVRAIEALVPAFVSACEQDADNTYAQIVTALAATLTLLLSELDRDVEVKTASLACAGAVCASLGKFSQEKEIQSLMEGLCDKLGNETSRVQAAKALASVFASAGANESAVALVAPKSAETLVTFLRKADRALRHCSLDALLALVRLGSPASGDSGALLDDALVAQIVENSAACVVDAEPAAAAAALSAASAALRRSEFSPLAAEAARVHTLTAALALCASARSRRGGGSQQSLRHALRSFFGDLVEAQLDGASHAEVREALFSKAEASGTANSRDVGVAVGECVASACLAANAGAIASTSKTLVDDFLADGTSNPTRQKLAMYCLGELGKVGDDADDTVVSPDEFSDTFEKAVRAAFDAHHASLSGDGLTSAAAYALGGFCAGALYRERFLAVTLGGLDGDGADEASADSQRSRYAFLLATRVLIESAGEVDSFFPDDDGTERKKSCPPLTDSDAQAIIAGLRLRAETETEEGARVVLAECLGRLAATRPDALLPELEADVRSGSENSRMDSKQKVVAVLAAKHAVLAVLSSGNAGLITQVTDRLPFFVGKETLQPASPAEVRIAAMRVLSAAAHGLPSIVVDKKNWIETVSPLLFAQTIIDPSLITVVDLGPFKHTVDGGLETRKAAFECVGTVVNAFGSTGTGGAGGHLPGDGTNAEVSNFSDFLGAAPASFPDGVASAIATGAGDHYDVKMLTHALLCKVLKSKLGAEAVGKKLKEIAAAMTKTLTQKMKSDAVKQEIDRNSDLVRSCLKAVVGLTIRLPRDVTETEDFDEFITKVVRSEKVVKQFEEAVAAAGGVGE